jgi:dienelactone hydrolase
MTERYAHLGPFSDLVDAVAAQQPRFPLALPGPGTQARVREALAFEEAASEPVDVRVEERWEADGVAGEAVSWSVGYGPRTEAWVLRPAGATGPLPGVVALHDHGGYKYFGKEKIADGPNGTEPDLHETRERAYGGRAFANELARRGFTVLVPDVFLGGSRRYPLEAMPDLIRTLAETTDGTEPERYNAAARPHEDLVAKYCALLGTTVAGIVAAEDRLAVRYLQSRPDVRPDAIGCVGLSGGGARAVLLQATCDAIRASVVAGMMSTYASLLDRHVTSHTWMLFPNGWSRHGDWPDIAACRAPSPLLVQYLEDDALFPLAGMRAAHERLAGHYTAVDAAGGYEGEFYPGHHRFDLDMQESAFAWIARQLDD